MIYVAHLHAFLWRRGRHVSLIRPVEVPFPPFPGLRIVFDDYDSACRRSQAAGFPEGDIDTTYIVSSVTWDVVQGVFRIHEKAGESGESFFRHKFEDDADLSRDVRLFTEILGFRVESDR